ncbi:MAG: 2-C-methyl-D-erythritol 4-phosphate cytidylyltransferase [Clostridiales bacterium]|nr:2-C-methyl-D-erythritol 4-phosphate cytidylyltransferase [Clostridiales bacterium]
MKITAIILAGGKGKRMKSTISKQFIKVNEKPILYYALKKFNECELINDIILVLPKDEVEYCKENIIEKYNLHVDKIVCGGKERQDSVYNGLIEASGSDIVLIHDGARAFVSKEIIENGIHFAKLYGAAAPGVMPKDTIKIKDNDSFSKETLKRDELVMVQTPQVFDYNLILSCHEKIKTEGIIVTDDTMVIEKYLGKVYLYNGEYTNIKITTPEDLIIAEYLAKIN